MLQEVHADREYGPMLQHGILTTCQEAITQGVLPVPRLTYVSCAMPAREDWGPSFDTRFVYILTYFCSAWLWSCCNQL
jgi:hypothetical protein